VSITKVVVLFTSNPTKLSLHFSDFSTIFYAFYKFQQMEYTIEDVTLRRGPQNSGGSGGALGRVKVRSQAQAHLGSVGGLGSGRGVAGVGARRWPAAAAAAARGFGEGRGHG
jgi:hypothetical protein